MGDIRHGTDILEIPHDNDIDIAVRVWVGVDGYWG